MVIINTINIAEQQANCGIQIIGRYCLSILLKTCFADKDCVKVWLFIPGYLKKGHRCNDRALTDGVRLWQYNYVR